MTALDKHSLLPPNVQFSCGPLSAVSSVCAHDGSHQDIAMIYRFHVPL